MDQVQLTVEKREVSSKSALRTLRRTGFVPGVVYHRGDPTESVKVSGKKLLEALRTDAGRNVLIDLKVQGDQKKKKRVVVVKELQLDPLKGDILHMDLHQISLTEKIQVEVPIVEKGEAPGVKNEGGVLELPIRHIQVECLPTDIPGDIEVDISHLELNHSIHVKDLSIPSNVQVLTDPEAVVVLVAVPRVEIEEPVTGEEATEPEVIGEKKEEGEEGEAAEGKEAKKEEKAPEKTEKPEKKEK